MTWDESQGLPRHKSMQVKQLVDGWCTAHACTLLGGETKEPVVQMVLLDLHTSRYSLSVLWEAAMYADVPPTHQRARLREAMSPYTSHPAHLDRRFSYAAITYSQMCAVCLWKQGNTECFCSPAKGLMNSTPNQTVKPQSLSLFLLRYAIPH